MNETKDRKSLFVLLGLATILAYWVIAPYLEPLVWGAIMAFALSPIQRFIKKWISSSFMAALLTVFLFCLLVLLPLTLLAVPIGQEIFLETLSLRDFLQNPSATLPSWLIKLPFIGHKISLLTTGLRTNTQMLTGVTGKLESHLMEIGNQFLSIASSFGHWLIKLLIMLLGTFAFLFHGQNIWEQISRLSDSAAGENLTRPLGVIPPTTKGIIYGLFFTSLAQALLAAPALKIAGVPNILLLSTAIFIASLFPVGATIIWLPATIYLLATGHPITAVVFASWNMLVSGGMEHFVKPMFIGRTSHIPFLMILLGVLGGLETFGLIGLFIGPIILSVFLEVWRHMLPPQSEAH